MRIAVTSVALLTLCGCVASGQTPPPLARTNPPAATGTSPAASSLGASAATTPPVPVPPSTPASTRGSPSTAAPPPAVPSPSLTAHLPPTEMRRLHEDAQRRIEEAERLLRQLEGRTLAAKDVETLRLAQSLVEQARKALGGEEYERAVNLAVKARTLAEDLQIPR